MEFIKKGWHGEFKALDLILGSILYTLVIVGIVFVGLGFIHSTQILALFLISIYVLNLPVGIWLSVALWRGVRNSHWFWKYAIRTLVIYGWLSPLLKWVINQQFIYKNMLEGY